jgi:hypothetical protein
MKLAAQQLEKKRVPFLAGYAQPSGKLFKPFIDVRSGGRPVRPIGVTARGGNDSGMPGQRQDGDGAAGLCRMAMTRGSRRARQLRPLIGIRRAVAPTAAPLIGIHPIPSVPSLMPRSRATCAIGFPGPADQPERAPP